MMSIENSVLDDKFDSRPDQSQHYYSDYYMHKVIKPVWLFHRRKDDNDNGMVVAEVGLPSGFAGDISKTRATGLEHKEATPDAVILYFKNVR